MSRPRVLLLEDDTALASILLQFFEFEGINATLCGSITELKQRIGQDPECVIVADSWTSSVDTALSLEEREQILELSQMTAGVILTTGRAWATHVQPKFSTGVFVMPKPYDLDKLGEAIHEAWARAKNAGLTAPE
jgi:DNA-binding NtrC family response regulator